MCFASIFPDTLVDTQFWTGGDFIFIMQRPKRLSQFWNLFRVFDDTIWLCFLGSIAAVTASFVIIAYFDKREWINEVGCPVIKVRGCVRESSCCRTAAWST